MLTMFTFYWHQISNAAAFEKTFHTRRRVFTGRMLFEFILLKGVRFSVRSLKKKADANNAKPNNEFFIFLGIKFHKYHLILFSPLALVGRR